MGADNDADLKLFVRRKTAKDLFFLDRGFRPDGSRLGALRPDPSEERDPGTLCSTAVRVIVCLVALLRSLTQAATGQARIGPSSAQNSTTDDLALAAARGPCHMPHATGATIDSKGTKPPRVVQSIANGQLIDLSNWDVEDIDDATRMFFGATSFTHQLRGAWSHLCMDIQELMFDDRCTGSIAPRPIRVRKRKRRTADGDGS